MNTLKHKSALDTQVGYMAGNVIKYVARYQDKNGIEDLKKARHYIHMMIEFEQEADKKPVKLVALSLGT